MFQGALHSLNPVQRVGDQIAEPILLHDEGRPKAADKRVGELLEQVGLPARRASSLPAPALRRPEAARDDRDGAGLRAAAAHRRRADDRARRDGAGAGARPADARWCATSASGWYVISHDLSVLGSTCDRLAVMYAGRIVEEGPAGEVFDATPAPLRAGAGRRLPDASATRLRSRPPACPATRRDPATCRAAARSTRAAPTRSTVCRTEDVELRDVGRRRHRAACVRARRGGAGMTRDRAHATAPTPGVVLEARGVEVTSAAGAAGKPPRAPSTASTSRSAAARSSRWSGVRLRQDDPGPHPARSRAADAGQVWSTASRWATGARRAEGLPPAGAARAAGPVRRAQPAAHGLRGGRRRPPRPRVTRQRGASGSPRRFAAGLRPPERFFLRYPHALRRPAPARRDRRRPGPRAGHHRRRRARLQRARSPSPGIR